jgi:hypothetical protein
MYFETALTSEEQQTLNSYSKVIVWGFPLHTHTHSYIHAMWVKVFKEGFGKETYWFHDDNFPIDFDYENSIFLTEGYADKNIPIVSSSVYFVHNAIFPEKYLDKQVRLIEIRFNVQEIHDVNNDFKLDDGTHENITYLSNETKYEKLYSNKDIHISKRGTTVKEMNYECVYLYWATDLFPHEFDFNNIPDKQTYVLNYVGSTQTQNTFAFKNICQQNGIQWNYSDPWNTPVSFEENRRLMRQSILCPDFRPTGTQQDIDDFGVKNGKNHMEIGYLPCRVLKAISYGHIGITDCIHIKNILGEHILFHNDMNVLFEMAMKERNNVDRIREAMQHVQERHTYVQRARDLIRALSQ